MARAAALNIAKTWLLVLLLTAPLGALGWLLGGITTSSLFALCALLAAMGAYRFGDRALLGMLGARPYAVAESPSLRSTVETAAARIGVRPPALYLIEDGLPRTLIVGRGPSSASLAVSRGALTALREEELAALVAHELAHVRRRDVLVQTLVVLLAVTLVETSRIGGWLARALLYALAPIAAAFVHLLLSPRRELHADALAAQTTGAAHDLADAHLPHDPAAELGEFAA
ncbi:MAG: M48 family metalloprotease, partial [Thermoleophilia bacterium]|nr:M48 family metalloprotease [Thermoleophilia bacterium]